MSSRTCLLLSGLVAMLGAALRLGVPVTPPDEGLRDVLRIYRAIDDMRASGRQ